MERQRSQRIAARVGAVAGLIDIDADVFVLRAVLLEFVPTAGGERKARAVVNGPALQRARGGDEARIINVAPPPSACSTRVPCPATTSACANLHVSRFADDRKHQHAQHNLHPAQPRMERRRTPLRRSLASQRQQDSGNGEVRQHRRAPVAQKRRGHTREREQTRGCRRRSTAVPRSPAGKVPAPGRTRNRCVRAARSAARAKSINRRLHRLPRYRGNPSPLPARTQ